MSLAHFMIIPIRVHGLNQPTVKTNPTLPKSSYATYIGRAFVYGLGVKGEAGVTEALNIIKKELDTTMVLCGERLVTDLGHHTLPGPPEL